MYVNYEILCNVMACKLIDLSKVEILKLNNSEMGRKKLEKYISY
jgi:hypothetical protein